MTAGPQIGVDSWVAEAEERRQTTRLRQLFERVPRSVSFAVFIGAAALVPVFSSNEYVIRVGVDTLEY